MHSLAVSTVVHLPPDDVYAFLLDFPGYADYSKYLTDVTQRGDGGPGTDYELRFEWWTVGYTAHSRVTAVDPPNAIDWELTKDVDAHGRWLVDPAPDDAPPDAPGASRVTLLVNYDPDTAAASHLDLPRFVPVDRVVDRAIDLIAGEGERVVERVVTDLEGEPRAVDLTVERTAD